MSKYLFTPEVHPSWQVVYGGLPKFEPTLALPEERELLTEDMFWAVRSKDWKSYLYDLTVSWRPENEDFDKLSCNNNFGLNKDFGKFYCSSNRGLNKTFGYLLCVLVENEIWDSPLKVYRTRNVDLVRKFIWENTNKYF